MASIPGGRTAKVLCLAAAAGLALAVPKARLAFASRPDGGGGGCGGPGQPPCPKNEVGDDAGAVAGDGGQVADGSGGGCGGPGQPPCTS